MTHSRERRRVLDVYARYARSARRRRSWSSENAGNVAVRAELVESVFALVGDASHSARRILDVGCGAGWWLERLAAEPGIRASLHGIDVLPERIQSARARVPTAALTVGDARHLPYSASSFDVVTMFTVLSSLAGRADATRAVEEGWRVLSPGGMLLIWEPRVPNALNRSTSLIRYRVVRDTLPDAELDSRTLTLLPQLARRLGGHTERLYPLLARIPPLRTHRLICARAPASRPS